MDLLLRIGSSLIGLVMVLAFLRSIIQVALINRQGGDWLARHVGRLVYRRIARVARRRAAMTGYRTLLPGFSRSTYFPSSRVGLRWCKPGSRCWYGRLRLSTACCKQSLPAARRSARWAF